MPEVFTNDLGEYRLSGIPPGSYAVEATYRSLLPVLGPGNDTELSYPTLYYPGVPDLNQSQPLDLKAGDEHSSIDFQMTPVRAVRIQGHVVAAREGKAEAIVVSAGRHGAAVDPSTGVFDLREVLPGSYLLCARYFVDSHDGYARLPLEVGNSDITGITLTPSPGASVRGRIALTEEARSLAKLDFAALGAHLQPQESPEECHGESLPDGRVEADGHFEFRYVPSGSFSIDVSGLPADFYLKGESGIQVDSDDIDGVDLVVSPFGGTIDGTILDGSKNPVFEAKVILSPETKNKNVRTAWTDQNGRYSIRGVRPGKYRLLAWDRDEAAMHDPMNLSDSEKKLGKGIEIEERSRKTVELILEDVQ